MKKIKVPHWYLILICILLTAILAIFNPSLYETTFPDLFATFIGVIAGFSLSLTVGELSEKHSDSEDLRSVDTSLNLEMNSHKKIIERLYISRISGNFVIDHWMDTGLSTSLYFSSLNSGSLSRAHP